MRIELPIISLVLVIASTVFFALTTTAHAAAAVSSASEKARKRLCTRQGGVVEEYSIWNGYAPAGTDSTVGIQIGKPLEVCSFPNADGTCIDVVALDTLASTQPTLAVLAFRSRITPNDPAADNTPDSSANVDPASLYCAQLFGTSAGIANAASATQLLLPLPNESLGWWAQLNATGHWFGVSDICVFADGSAMGTLTLTYHVYNPSDRIKFAYNP